MDMTKVTDWLEGIPSKNTRKSYKNGIKKFEKYYGLGIETLIGSKNAGRTIEKFYVWLKEKGYSQNTCRNVINTPIQFLKYFDTPVKYRRSLGMYKTVPTTRDHMITIDQVQEMAKVSDLREQILLEVFIIGLRVGDISKLKWKTFENQGKTPIPIQILTEKEEIVAKTFISEEFNGLLSKYLQTIDKENPYLFQSSRNGYLSGKRINAILKELGDRAGIKSHGLFRWHIGRKLFLRTCAELGINQWNAKILCGKSVSPDIATYINGVQLTNDFLKISNVLRLFPQSVPKYSETIDQMQKSITTQQMEIKDFKTRLEAITSNYEKLDKKMKQMSMDFMELSSVVQPFMMDLKEKKPLLDLVFKQQEDKKKKDSLENQN